MEVIFWVSGAFVVYAYAGYPVLLWLVARVRNKVVHKAPITPPVTLVITARNEEANIAAKIDNALALDYPTDRIEICIASDCSTDRTDEIVRGYAAQGVRLVRAPERRGKEFAQKLAIAESANEILVFSDVGTRFEPDAIRTIVANFADPTVGSVSSVDRLIDRDGRLSGEGAYVRYEMMLRSLETRAGSVVGLSGSFFAARRIVCQQWAVNLPSDFMTLISTLRHGLRGISDPASIGYYRDLADGRKEFDRKVRTIVRGLSGLLAHLDMLNPLKYGLAAWQLFSHKLCRWLVPFAMIGMLVSNAVLAVSSPWYLAVLAAQVIAYGMAIAGMLASHPPSGLPRLVTFLVLANLSVLNAWYSVVRGRRVVAWEPSRR